MITGVCSSNAHPWQGFDLNPEFSVRASALQSYIPNFQIVSLFSSSCGRCDDARPGHYTHVCCGDDAMSRNSARKPHFCRCRAMAAVHQHLEMR